jgi:YfiH family protein
MHTWHWQTWQDLPYLTCSLLESFPHGFFTQHYSPRPPAELVEAVQPQVEVYRVRQVHGNAVLTPTEIDTALQQNTDSTPAIETADLPPADGLLTERGAQAVWVCTADCVPALIADVKTGQVAAVHAGWRGTAQEIVPQAIARLQQQGSQLEDLRVALGPAIAGEVYQVSTTVAAQVGATVVKEVMTDTNANLDQVLEALHQLPDSPLLNDPEPGRVRLDVRRVNALQLEQLGLDSEQIAIAPYCTYQHADYFFSYRRDRLKKVQWSGIVSKGE